MYLFINGTQRQYIRNSIKITDELQERVNSAVFSLDGSFDVSSYEEVKIYEGTKIVSLSGTSLVVSRDYSNTNLFIKGAEIWLGLGESTEEKVIIDSVNGINITLTANAVSSHSGGELMGIKKFGGAIINIGDYNNTLLRNLQYQITCVDYTKVFDKELINESYEDRTARYIINDFCNQFINKNQEIDEFDYENNTEIQAKWIESGDGNNPVIDDSDFKEKDMSGVFSWTNSGGTATFTYTLSSKNISSYTGVSSGTPTQGKLGIWLKALNYANITNIQIEIGSDSSNKATKQITPADNSWNFEALDLKDFTIVGTPDWTNTDYFVVVITETASSSIQLDGVRILEDEFFKHFPYVEDSTVFSNFNLARIKPIETMQRLADELAWYWYIDYNRNIRLFPQSKNIAPFSINETSNNFSGLSITHDTKRLINRQMIKGSDEVSDSVYSQVVEGNGVIKEWLMKNKFKNLVVSLDDNSSTDTTEAGTTTTNIKATSHGLITGNYIVNRSRSNAVRQIVKVDDDNFTVLAVTAQTSGDTFSKFIEKNVGVEGINLDAGYDFMSNFNEKSIRNSEDELTLIAGEFLLFEYNEVVPILVQRKSATSIANMQSVLGYSNGIFDGSPVTDRTIETRSEAIALAETYLNKYSNVIINAKFKTTYEGLESGQLIRIKDTTSSNRNIDPLRGQIFFYVLTCSKPLLHCILPDLYAG